MKTIITTLFIAAVSLIGSTGNVSAKESFYKNDEMNKNGQVVKTTISKGEDGRNLAFVKQLEIKYDQNGNLQERAVYTWDSEVSKWIPKCKYQFDYSEDGQLLMLSYITYNKSQNEWDNEIKYAMYTYGDEGNLLSINYLNIGKEYEALASDFSLK